MPKIKPKKFKSKLMRWEKIAKYPELYEDMNKQMDELDEMLEECGDKLERLIMITIEPAPKEAKPDFWYKLKNIHFQVEGVRNALGKYRRGHMIQITPKEIDMEELMSRPQIE